VFTLESTNSGTIFFWKTVIVRDKKKVKRYLKYYLLNTIKVMVQKK